MNIDLTGKTALVTGSTEGIGFAIAGGLAVCGASVVINGRSQESVDAAIAAILAEAPEARLTGIVADLSAATGCSTLLSALPDVDILVNSVGTFEQRIFFDIDDDGWNRMFEINVMSGVRLSRGYLKGMMEKDWGRVIFISSESAVNIPPDMLHYAFSKTAQLALSRGLAKLAQGTGVTVNCVLPGPTLTEGVERMLQAQADQEGKTVDQVGIEFVKAKRPSSIIQRLASPREVASMVVYLCSPQASATTGAAIRVDGGTIDSIY